MNDLEFAIIDELYFVTTFQDLLKDTAVSKLQLTDILISLLQKDWVQQLNFVNGDYQKKDKLDLQHLENYAYLATKKALLIHNGLR